MYNVQPPVKLSARAPQKRLKLLLVDREMEQSALATATGLSISLVEKIATGHRAPTQRTIRRLENFFGARIFSSRREYRARQKKLQPGVIEFSAAPPFQNDLNATSATEEPTT